MQKRKIMFLAATLLLTSCSLDGLNKINDLKDVTLNSSSGNTIIGNNSGHNSYEGSSSTNSGNFSPSSGQESIYFSTGHYNEEICLTIYDPFGNDFLDIAIEEYRSINPNVSFNLTDDINDENIDVYCVSNESISVIEYIKNEKVLSIPDYYFDSYKISDPILDKGRYDESQYFIPYAMNQGLMMFYDKSQFNEEDVTSLNSILFADTRYSYNIVLPLDNGWYAQTIFFSMGCYMDNVNQIINFNNQDALNMSSIFIKELSMFPKILVRSEDYLLGEESAACISGTWNIDAFRGKLGNNYGCVPLPNLNFDGNDYVWKDMANYRMIGINSNSRQRKLALEFASFFASPEMQESRFNNAYSIYDGIPTSERTIYSNYNLIYNYPEIIQFYEHQSYSYTCPIISYLQNGYFDKYFGFYDNIIGSATEEDVFIAAEKFNESLII